MKIIAVGRNYALHNLELGNTEENREPVIFLKPDSALLRKKDPFFYPDFSQNIHYETEVVLHICRQGKQIAPRFAHRYYDAVTVGIDFTARDLQSQFQREGKPWELSKGFDGSAVVGTLLPLEQVGGDVQNLHFHLEINEVTVQQGHTADMLFTVDQTIAYVSSFMKLKMGDLLFTGTPAGVGPIAIGQHLQGYLGEEKLLDFYIR